MVAGFTVDRLSTKLVECVRAESSDALSASPTVSVAV